MIRNLLAPLGWAYGAATDLRNAAFERGILGSEDAGVPVVSVGNITAGGSGKTPLVEHIVRRLIARGATPGVISRGYGRESRGVVVVSDGRTVSVDARQGGDEPVQIALACPGVRVVVGERRVEAARASVDELGADVLVMDDGFQHRYLRRSLDIVILDSRKDPFEDRVLPAGMLRERTKGLRRADLVALSRSETGDVAWRGKLDRVFHGPVVAFATRGEKLRPFNPGRSTAGGEEMAGSPMVAFSGIGDHSLFVSELRRIGVPVAADRRFRDHHWYRAEDAAGLVELLRASGASGFATTEKDAVRLRAEPSVAAALETAGPIHTLAVTVKMTGGGDELEAALVRQVWKPRTGSLA